MNTIYKDGNYEISQHGTSKAILTNGGKKVVFPLRAPAEEIPQNYLDSLRRAGHDPADYFFVGVPGSGTILRRAALTAWEAAVEASQKKAKEEKAAKEAAKAAEIATQGQKALMFHGPYSTKASLVVIRPAKEEERARFTSPWYRENLYVELESTPVDSGVAERLHAEWNLASQGNKKHTLTQDSCIFFLTEEQWNAVIDGNEGKRRLLAEKIEMKKRMVKEVVIQKFEAALKLAKETGQPVEFRRISDYCDGSQPECDLDILSWRVSPDGEIVKTRTHCH